MAKVLLNEMLSKAQTSLKSMAGHVDSIIAERRAIRQSLKSLEPTGAALKKDSGLQGQQRGKQRRDVAENLTAVQTSVERLTEASTSVLQVGRSRSRIEMITAVNKSSK